jgi:signal transduction histidine kinase/DNA-binding response OmpR family regulator
VNTPLLGPDGKLAYIFNRVEDVTEFMMLKTQGTAQQQLTDHLEQRTTQMEVELFDRSQELQKLNAELLAASKAKSLFLNDMSHELRTPLSAILGFAELLIDDDEGRFTATARRGFLEHIHTGGQRLLSLINDLLDLAKVEAGQMILRLEAIRVSSVINEVVSSIEPLAAKKRLTVETKSDPGGELVADPAKLTQMLLNLVANAIKFTPEGGLITIEARPAGAMLEISVTDTGIGIAEVDRGRIFHEFQQLDSGAGRQAVGTGLGLALTRRYAVLHGGDVRVESEFGHGSVFTLSLPRSGGGTKPEIAIDPAVISAADAVAESARPLVLIVEDDPVMAELLTHIAERGGFRTVIATTAIDALAKARELQPVAITLDVILPQLDGWELLAMLKHDEATSAIPVAVVSVLNDPELAVALGAIDYFVKPIRSKELLSSLSRFRFESAAGSPKVQVLVVDDEAANRALLAAMLEPAGFAVTMASGGLEGIQLAKTGKPDLILLDLMMPDTTGFDVIKALRADEATRATPIMVLTAKEMTDADKRLLNGQVSAILSRGSTGSEDLLGQLHQLVALNSSD